MRNVLTNLTALCVALVLVASVAAQKQPARGGPVAALFRAPKTATAEQKAGLAKLKEEYGAKAEAAYKKVTDSVPAEKLKAVNEAVAKARKEGKKRQELQQVRRAAMKENFTKEETKAYNAANKEFTALRKEIVEKKNAIIPKK